MCDMMCYGALKSNSDQDSTVLTQTQTWQLIIVGKTKWHRSFKNAAESKYEFVQTELVFYDIKWISSGAFELFHTKCTSVNAVTR
jgi:hypothetical protein